MTPHDHPSPAARHGLTRPAMMEASPSGCDETETPAPASAVLPPASYRRLRNIKSSYDPDQMIISTHPAWPARVRA